MNLEFICRIISNILLVSLPEGILMTLVIYYVSNKKLINALDLCSLKMNLKLHKKEIFLPAMVYAIISNVVRHSNISNFYVVLSMFAMYIIVLNTNIKDGKNKKIIMLHTLGGVLVALLLTGLTEVLFTLLFITVTGIGLEHINSSILLVCVLSIPIRLLQSFVVFILFIKYNKSINLVPIIFQKKYIILILSNLVTFALIIVTLMNSMMITLSIILAMYPIVTLLVIGYMQYKKEYNKIINK